MLLDWQEVADGSDGKSRELVLMLLDNARKPFSRKYFKPGHVTGTACVLHPYEDAFLLVHHRRLNRWLFPGGHVEPDDDTIFETARREAIEETGVVVSPASPRIVGVDVHGIPAKGEEPYHLHHDIVITFRAASDTLIASAETRDVIWCRPGEARQLGLAGSIQRAVARAMNNGGSK
jgi:8-oxo-dGTP pyrophosphatase MutT (NUDIX family)